MWIIITQLDMGREYRGYKTIATIAIDVQAYNEWSELIRNKYHIPTRKLCKIEQLPRHVGCCINTYMIEDIASLLREIRAES